MRSIESLARRNDRCRLNRDDVTFGVQRCKSRTYGLDRPVFLPVPCQSSLALIVTRYRAISLVGSQQLQA